MHALSALLLFDRKWKGAVANFNAASDTSCPTPAAINRTESKRCLSCSESLNDRSSECAVSDASPVTQCRSAQPIIRPMKASQASICERATNSLGWWAWEMSPGPQITVGMPWLRKMPASVP